MGAEGRQTELLAWADQKPDRIGRRLLRRHGALCVECACLRTPYSLLARGNLQANACPVATRS